MSLSLSAGLETATAFYWQEGRAGAQEAPLLLAGPAGVAATFRLDTEQNAAGIGSDGPQDLENQQPPSRVVFAGPAVPWA